MICLYNDSDIYLTICYPSSPNLFVFLINSNIHSVLYKQLPLHHRLSLDIKLNGCYWEGWKLFFTFHTLPIYSQILMTNCCGKVARKPLNFYIGLK